MGNDESFPKSVRIRTQREFDLVHQSNHFAADETLVIRGRLNGLKVSRLGLSIGKRVGNAVVRNQWKRKIRDAFRKQQSDVPAGLDLVVRPRKGADCDYRAISQSLTRLVKRLDQKISRTLPPPNSEESH